MNNTFKHSGKYGDLVLGLPVVMQLGGGDFYLLKYQYSAIGELLERQPYIKNVIPIEEDKWDKLVPKYNLDLFRKDNDISIIKMHLKTFNIDFDLEQPWLFNIEPLSISKIVIHDTSIGTSPGYTVNWELLRGREKDCIFVSYSDGEYENFVSHRKLNIARYKPKNLYEVARVIAGSQLFVCNQSCPYTIAEGLKVPLVLDLYIGKPQYPLGKSGFTDLSEEILERFVK